MKLSLSYSLEVLLEETAMNIQTMIYWSYLRIKRVCGVGGMSSLEE